MILLAADVAVRATQGNSSERERPLRERRRGLAAMLPTVWAACGCAVATSPARDEPLHQCRVPPRPPSMSKET